MFSSVSWFILMVFLVIVALFIWALMGVFMPSMLEWWAFAGLRAR
jgi:hypothetical protein